MNRDFEYKNIKFHLNDYARNEFESKYELLYFNEFYGKWIGIGYPDTKKQAIEMARDWYGN